MLLNLKKLTKEYSNSFDVAFTKGGLFIFLIFILKCYLAFQPMTEFFEREEPIIKYKKIFNTNPENNLKQNIVFFRIIDNQGQAVKHFEKYFHLVSVYTETLEDSFRKEQAETSEKCNITKHFSSNKQKIVDTSKILLDGNYQCFDKLSEFEIKNTLLDFPNQYITLKVKKCKNGRHTSKKNKDIECASDQEISNMLQEVNLELIYLNSYIEEEDVEQRVHKKVFSLSKFSKLVAHVQRSLYKEDLSYFYNKRAIKRYNYYNIQSFERIEFDRRNIGNYGNLGKQDSDVLFEILFTNNPSEEKIKKSFMKFEDMIVKYWGNLRGTLLLLDFILFYLKYMASWARFTNRIFYGDESLSKISLVTNEKSNSDKKDIEETKEIIDSVFEQEDESAKRRRPSLKPPLLKIEKVANFTTLSSSTLVYKEKITKVRQTHRNFNKENFLIYNLIENILSSAKQSVQSFFDSVNVRREYSLHMIRTKENKECMRFRDLDQLHTRSFQKSKDVESKRDRINWANVVNNKSNPPKLEDNKKSEIKLH